MTYVKRKGVCDSLGEDYEIEMAALMFLRGLNYTSDFYIASNHDMAGDFDDLIFIHRMRETEPWRTFFVQLKHKANQVVIRRAALLRLNRKSDFGIPGYFESYCKVLQNLHIFEAETGCSLNQDRVTFVLYTNALLEGDLKQEDEESLLNTDGFEVNIGKDEYNDLFNLIDEIPSYKLLLESLGKETDSGIIEQRIRTQRSVKHIELVSRLKRLNGKINFSEELKKLLEEVREIGNITQFKEFAAVLKFLCGETHQSDLHFYIKMELATALSISGKTMDFIYKTLINNIKCWWKDGQTYLTKHSGIWRNILELHVSSLDINVKHYSRLQFSPAAVDNLKCRIANKRAVAVVSDDSNEISITKLLQCLKDSKHFVVTTTVLVNRLEEILCLWVSSWYDNLIVDLSAVPETVNVKCLCNKLCGVLKFKRGKKLILVLSSVVNDIFDYFKTLLGSSWDEIYDNSCLRDLSQPSSEMLLNMTFSFQGKCITYKKILEEIPSINKIFNGKTIKHILENDSIKIGKELFCEDKVYVERTLKRQCYINEMYFETLRKASCIAITGLEASTLESKLYSKHIVLTFFELTEYKCEIEKYKFIFVVLGADDPYSEFDTLGLEFPSRDLHWFEYSNERWKWCKSKTSLNEIRKYMSEDMVSHTVENVITSREKVIPLVGGAGMGKSIFIKKLAEKIKCNNPCFWVIILDFSKIKHFLEVTVENIVRVLGIVSGIADDEFGKRLLRHCYFEASNLVVLLDGADEMHPSLREQTFQISNMLVNNPSINKVIVTSRPITNFKLEELGNSFSYQLETFRENDLEEYFKQYWEQEVNCSIEIRELVSYSMALARTFEIYKKNCFLSIPLHAYMLAEAVKAHREELHNLGEIQKFDMIQLYQSFFDTKISLSLSGILNFTNMRTENILKRLRTAYLNSHMYLALKSVFSSSQISTINCTENLQQNIADAIDEIENEHERTGIIQGIHEGVPQFVHRSFAEYLSALWLSKNYLHSKKLLQVVLVHKDLQLVWDIFNKFLCRDLQTHMSIISDDTYLPLDVDINEKDLGNRTPLHISVMYNKTASFESLVSMGALFDERDNVLEWTPLQYADALSRWKILEIILQFGCLSLELSYLQSKIRNIHDKRSVVKKFASAGYVKLLQYVISEGILLNDVIDGRHFSAIHVAAYNGQLEVVKYINETISKEKEPTCEIFTICKPLPVTAAIHSALHGGHFEIVKYFIDNTQCVTVLNEFRRLPIHCACLIKVAGRNMNIDIQEVLNLIQTLIDKGSNLNAKDVFGLTPLHCCVYRVNIPAIKLLIKNGADINAQDGRGFTALHIAVNKRFIDSHKRPMTPYINDKNRGKKKANLSSNYNGETNRLVAFLLEAGIEVNARDSDRNTALHIAAWSGELDVVKRLVAGGADPSAKGRHHRTPLQVAAQWADSEVVKFLMVSESCTDRRADADEVKCLLLPKS